MEFGFKDLVAKIATGVFTTPNASTLTDHAVDIRRCTVPPFSNHFVGNLAMISISLCDKTYTNSPTGLGQ